MVSSAETFRRSDHPVCASLCSAQPPLLYEEGNAVSLLYGRVHVSGRPHAEVIDAVRDIDPAVPSFRLRSPIHNSAQPDKPAEQYAARLFITRAGHCAVHHGSNREVIA